MRLRSELSGQSNVVDYCTVISKELRGCCSPFNYSYIWKSRGKYLGEGK